MLNRTSIWGGSWRHRKWRHLKLHHRKSPEVVSPEVTGNDFIGTIRGLLGKRLGVSHRTFHFSRGNIDRWKPWNSTNEMPQSLFQLANHGSPYRSNECVRTIYFWPFVEALSFVQSNSNVNLCFFQFDNRNFHSSFHSDRTCLSCGIENLYSNKGKHLNPIIIF